MSESLNDEGWKESQSWIALSNTVSKSYCGVYANSPTHRIMENEGKREKNDNIHEEFTWRLLSVIQNKQQERRVESKRELTVAETTVTNKFRIRIVKNLDEWCNFEVYPN
ncbi:hypothetical protein AVEN_247526-1 [Araneus ventricosus]|uniref:Uncharacterized protein n=1 Tax=Araneus ventricosus TaxID=182803 RepID=A0A4Y2PW43_ARAVE|nr:hypothetical protein AVEN_247526-1 [Araneus ventricosus]